VSDAEFSHPRLRSRRRPTIADVARAANVSSMTVSNVVNGRFASMTADTRAAVEKAIAQIGYRPHASGRSLKLARRFSIGMVVVDESPTFLADPFITHFVAGLSNYLSSRDYGLLVQGMLASHLPDAALIRRHETDALCVFLSGPKALRTELMVRFTELGQPVVVVQEPVPAAPGLYCVRQDDWGGAAELAIHMLDKGARDLLFLAPSTCWPAIEERILGIRSVVDEAGDCTFSVLECGDGGFEATQIALAGAVATGGWPRGIMGGNDQMGIAALKWCLEQGRRVPEDVLVSGFNAFETWRYSSPTMTTVVSPAYAMGERAGEILLQALQGRTLGDRESLLPTAIQLGGSTAV
jgi:LacI family transcriptional regulator